MRRTARQVYRDAYRLEREIQQLSERQLVCEENSLTDRLIQSRLDDLEAHHDDLMRENGYAAWKATSSHRLRYVWPTYNDSIRLRFWKKYGYWPKKKAVAV